MRLHWRDDPRNTEEWAEAKKNSFYRRQRLGRGHLHPGSLGQEIFQKHGIVRSSEIAQASGARIVSHIFGNDKQTLPLRLELAPESPSQPSKAWNLASPLSNRRIQVHHVMGCPLTFLRVA
ncbi:hypothetical protein K9B32_20875 [Rhizobium sp. 3T7]|uniref:hypothetical protein n=1 Tax=Rhizobium sp. 3T7 TaxID=2874922 RepID=UPI001CCAD176|nr:hypothetical protein [Rhizobium sp. 3T7]MBZ9792539.1 hypothetical protein [Rhizobium sp. 3T7]